MSQLFNEQPFLKCIFKMPITYLNPENIFKRKIYQYRNSCLLLRIVGHVSSAKAPEKLSNSNSFLQKPNFSIETVSEWKLKTKQKTVPSTKQTHVPVVMNRNSPLVVMKSNIACL